MPEIELLLASAFLSLKIVEHFVGKKTAKTPKIHIVLKSEPTSGFRQGMFPDTFGGNAVRIAIRIRLRNDKDIRKVISKLRCWLGDMIDRCS